MNPSPFGTLGVQIKAPDGMPQSILGVNPQHLALLQASQQSLLGHQVFQSSQYFTGLPGQQMLVYGYPQQHGKDGMQSDVASFAAGMTPGIAGPSLVSPGVFPPSAMPGLAPIGYPLFLPGQQPPQWLAPPQQKKNQQHQKLMMSFQLKWHAITNWLSFTSCKTST